MGEIVLPTLGYFISYVRKVRQKVRLKVHEKHDDPWICLLCNERLGTDALQGVEAQ